MTPRKPCLECGVAVAGTRCPPCEAKRQHARNQARTQYQGSWRTQSQKARAYATNCARCGIRLIRSNRSPQGSTYDHETGTVECRSCNSSHRRNPQ